MIHDQTCRIDSFNQKLFQPQGVSATTGPYKVGIVRMDIHCALGLVAFSAPAAKIVPRTLHQLPQIEAQLRSASLKLLERFLTQLIPTSPYNLASFLLNILQLIQGKVIKLKRPTDVSGRAILHLDTRGKDVRGSAELIALL